MHTTVSAASLLAVTTFLSTALASPILETRSVPVKRASGLELAVYWGQGPSQNRLADFCQDTAFDVIPIGFVNTFPDQAGNNGYPGTNYGNACGSPYWKSPDGTQTKMFTNCWQIAEDIPVCQAAGKKILVSLGGDSPGNFIASSTSAQAFADFLWGAYGPPQDTTETLFPRPFGTDVIVDGFDLDIESGSDAFYSDLVNELRAKFTTYSGKHFYISGAPQCVVPDAHLDSAIRNSEFDYVFVQYYNTDSCSAASLFASGSLSTSTDISYGWVNWLEQYSMNKNVKLFVGLPGSPSAAHSQDYLDLNEAQALITAYTCGAQYSPVFGGVMVWEATYSNNNQINGKSYAQNIKDIMNGISCPGQATTTTTTTTSTTTTTTSTTTTTTTTTTSTTTTTTTTTTIPVPTTTTTTTTTPVPTTTTTTTWAVVPTTTTTTVAVVPTTTSTTTTPVQTTTTTSNSQIGPINGSTTSSSSTWAWTTTSSSVSTTTSNSEVGPIGGSTSSSTSSTWAWTTTSGSLSSQTTTSSSSQVGPIGGSTSTSSNWVWTSSSTTTSSSAVGPISESTTSSSLATAPWEDWTTTTVATSTSPVSPISQTTTTTPGAPWEDWTTSAPVTTPASSTVAPDSTVTVITTNYIDVCPTGFITKTFTLTTTITLKPTSTPFVWPTGSNGVPSGFTTTVTTCTACGPTITVTLTIPQPTGAAPITQTVVPVESTPAGFAQISPTGTFVTVTGPIVTETRPAPSAAPKESTPVAPVAPVATSVSPVAAPVATSQGSNSAWLGVSGPASPTAGSNSSPVSPAVATFTGAASQQLPSSKMTVVFGALVAVAGLLI